MKKQNKALTLIKRIFASAGDLTPIPDTDPTGKTANYNDGFAKLRALPLVSGGVPVKREEINTLFSFVTQNLLAINSGTAMTFDSEIAEYLGGYSKGDILFSQLEKAFQLSLKDNNLANFVKDPNYINDGINWISIGAYPDIVDSNGVITIQQPNGKGAILRFINNDTPNVYTEINGATGELKVVGGILTGYKS